MNGDKTAQDAVGYVVPWYKIIPYWTVLGKGFILE
jgi:hypothetical protein